MIRVVVLGQSDSKAGKSLALHVANLHLILSIPSSPSSPTNIPEYRPKSKP